MKIVSGSIARSALRAVPLAMVVMGVAVTADAQSGNAGLGLVNGAQSGAANNGGVTGGMGATAAGGALTPGAGSAGSATTGGMTGGLTRGGSGGQQGAPALNTMRANGTSLYMSPDPRAPNVSGRAAPLK